jgi:hypothetical protein
MIRLDSPTVYRHPRLDRGSMSPWIPAFAGMTQVGNSVRQQGAEDTQSGSH